MPTELHEDVVRRLRSDWHGDPDLPACLALVDRIASDPETRIGFNEAAAVVGLDEPGDRFLRILVMVSSGPLPGVDMDFDFVDDDGTMIAMDGVRPVDLWGDCLMAHPRTGEALSGCHDRLVPVVRGLPGLYLDPQSDDSPKLNP